MVVYVLVSIVSLLFYFWIARLLNFPVTSMLAGVSAMYIYVFIMYGYRIHSLEKRLKREKEYNGK